MLSDLETLNTELSETDTTVSVRSMSKKFRLYKCSKDWVKQQLFPWRKYYDEFWALKDVSFDISKGESVLTYQKANLLRFWGITAPVKARSFRYWPER
jgi:hypothetical protein